MGIAVSGRRRRAPVLAFCAAACVCGLTLDGQVLAQSAADTATARAQAKQGIELFRAGKYAEALDRLNRAQALYDAPVHVLYLARCQRELGQLVEASENFRQLSRTTLPGDAPRPFFAAVEDAKKELAEITPRIPYLLLVVTPKDAANLVVANLCLPHSVSPEPSVPNWGNSAFSVN